MCDKNATVIDNISPFYSSMQNVFGFSRLTPDHLQLQVSKGHSTW